MSKGRRRLFNPGKNARIKMATKPHNPSARYRSVQKKTLSQMKTRDIHLHRQMLNMTRLEDIQNALSAVNFTIANCNEIIADIKANGDRTSRAFGKQLERELITYEHLRVRHSNHLQVVIGYDSSSRIPRKRKNNDYMNYCFRQRVKDNCRRNRITRSDPTISLNIDTIQASDTKAMMENEREVQGMESIKLNDYDKDVNEGDTFQLESLSARKRRRKKNIKGKGARGNNIIETFDEEDVFHDWENQATRYQFAFDLKIRDKNTGE